MYQKKCLIHYHQNKSNVRNVFFCNTKQSVYYDTVNGKVQRHGVTHTRSKHSNQTDILTIFRRNCMALPTVTTVFDTLTIIDLSHCTKTICYTINSSFLGRNLGRFSKSEWNGKEISKPPSVQKVWLKRTVMKNSHN